MTFLWFYDYALTFQDEVAGFHDGNDTERNLTTIHRSFMGGRRRTYSVRNLLRFHWQPLTDDISVFALFLFVSTLHHHRDRPNLRLEQIRSRDIPGVDRHR